MATEEILTSNDFYLWFYLSLKNYDDLSTETILITNRTLGAALSDTDSEHYPIIKSISGIGSTLSDFLPRRTSGQIVLDVSPWSFAHERRLIDLFQNYTPINQDIIIYTTFTKQNTPLINPSATGTAQIRSTVRSWSANFRSNELQLEISFDPIPNRALGYQINATDNPDALSSSLNRTLPVVVGAGVEAQAFSLNSDDTEPDFAFASNFGDDFQVSAVNSVKFKNRVGQYVPFANGNDAAAVLSDTYTIRSDSTSFTWTDTAVGTQEKAWFAWEIDSSNLSSGYLINRVEITGLSLGAGSTNNQNMTCGIYSKPSGDVVNPIALGESTINSDDYSAEITAASGTAYTMVFKFDPPVAMEQNEDHYFSLNFYVEEPVDFYWGSKNGSGTVQTVERYLRNGDLNVQSWNYNASTVTGGAGNLPRPQYKIYGVEYTPNLSASNKNESGFGYSYLSFTQYGASASEKAVLTDENFIVNCDGIKDDGSGTISGSAGLLLEDVEDVLKLLTTEFDGTNWNINSDLDVTTYATELAELATAGVKCAGRTSGRQGLKATLEDVLYSTACRIGLTSQGMTVAPMGKTLASSGRIDDSDARILNLEMRAADETIINKFIVNYDQQLSSNEFYLAANENDLRDFVGYYVLDAGSFVANSKDIFGIKELRNNRFLFAKTATHVQEVVEDYALVYGRQPIQLVTFDVPFLKYSNMEVFQVWELVSSRMPGFYGTSSDAYSPTYGGAVVTTGKFTETRAEEYRVKIESKKLFLNENSMPTLRIVARVKTDSLTPI